MIDIKKEERLELLIELQSISKVADKLKLDRSSLNKYFKRLEKNKIIEQREGHWIRTDNDDNLVELHNFEVVIKAEPVKEVFLEFLDRKGEVNYEINNSFKQYIMYFREIPNFIVRSTPNSIIFQQRKGFQIRLTRSQESIDKFYSILTNNIIEKKEFLEKKLNIKIGELDEIRIEIASNHIAFVGDVLAKYKEERKEKFEVFINGQKRVLFDLSAGRDKPHLEFPDKYYANPDGKKWNNFCEDLVTGRFNQKDVVTKDEFREVLNELKNEAIKPLTEQLKLHLSVEAKQDINMDKMNILLSRMLDKDKLFEDI